MTVQSGDQSLSSSIRGQSTVLGIVLLIGMVAVGSTALFLVATDSISSVEQDAEHDRVESGFVELSQQMEAASTSGDIPQSMDMDVGEHGAVVMNEAGTLRIEGGDGNESDGNYVNETLEIGAIEYTGDDGTKIAYQAGGVFRETGEETQVVSAPPIEYDDDSETLSFPIIKTQNEAELTSGQVTAVHNETNPMHNVSVVENDSVTVEVTSEYYRGWENYFESQGGASTVQDVEVHDDETGTVTAEYGFRQVSDAFKSGAVYATDITGNYDIEDSQRATYPPLDDEINQYVNNTDPDDDDVMNPLSEDNKNEDGKLEDGTYYTENDVTEELDFDLSDGNATLIVDGNISGSSDLITVSDYNKDGEEEHDLSIYLTGDYDASEGGQTCVAYEEDCTENEDGSVIQMVASSESEIILGTGGGGGGGNDQGIRFEGVIYAGGANDDWDTPCGEQVCIHSNPSFYGSLVASSVEARGGDGIEFKYDDSLEDEELSIYPDPDALPPQLTYLNVAEQRVDINVE